MDMPQRAIFVLGAFLASMTLVQAQDCVRINPGPCSLLNQARVIFVGTVIEEKKDSDTHKFRVTEAFNALLSKTLIDPLGGSERQRVSEIGMSRVGESG
jgi:hypothetical protein